LLERGAEALGDEPGNRIGAAARPERNDEGDRLARIGVGVGGKAEQDRADGQAAEQNLHAAPLPD